LVQKPHFKSDYFLLSIMNFVNYFFAAMNGITNFKMVALNNFNKWTCVAVAETLCSFDNNCYFVVYVYMLSPLSEVSVILL